MGERIFHEFEPVFDGRSKVLILGTMPSAASRRRQFYYGHPQNRFWKLMAALTMRPLPETIAEKRTLLLDSGIAVWDVLASCEIEGSSDASIQSEGRKKQYHDNGDGQQNVYQMPKDQFALHNSP